MPEDISDTIQNVFEAMASDINTTLPGTIVAYDASTNRATVRLSMPKRLADGRELEPPNVVSVPMVWPTSGGATMTMPVAVGDGVMLHFSSRSLDGWLNGQPSSPDDPRMFDISDAIAVPGLSARRAPVHSTNMVISFGAAKISITPFGEIILEGSKITIKSPVESTSTITATGQIQSGGVRLTTHTHGGGPLPS